MYNISLENKFVLTYLNNKLITYLRENLNIQERVPTVQDSKSQNSIKNSDKINVPRG